MNSEEGEDEDEPAELVGRPVAEAVDLVVAREEDVDREAVRARIESVSEDGVVSREAVEAAIGHANAVVSSPDTRGEDAGRAFMEVEQAAEPVFDLAVVRSRLDAIATRLDEIDARAAELGESVHALAEGNEEAGAAYVVAREVDRIVAEANENRRAARELLLDIETLERWLDNPHNRFRDLEKDADTVEASVDELSGSLDELTAALDGTGDDEASAAADGTDGVAQTLDDGTDVDVAWFDAALRRRLLALLVEDLRAELADLRAWENREGRDVEDRVEENAARLDALDDRLIAIDERLDDLARPEWTERFDERLSAVDAELDELEPPVDWGTVQGTIDEHGAVGADDE